MQKFKLLIKEGIEKRGFEVTQISDSNPEYWMEEWWVIKRNFDLLELKVVFMRHHMVASDSKIVSDVHVCLEVPVNPFYEVDSITHLSLEKGKFDLKLNAFFQRFDEYLVSLSD